MDNNKCCKADKLDVIFELQKSLDTEIQERRNLDFPMEQWIQKDVLAMISELAELLDEVNFKWWKNPKPINEADLTESLSTSCISLSACA